MDHLSTNLERNYGGRRWEIDILAVNSAELVAVEVKTTLGGVSLWGLQEIGWIEGSAVDTGGVEIKTAEVKVDGVAEALAVTKAAR